LVEKQLSDFELMELNIHIANHLQYNVFKDVGYIYCLELECGKYYVGYSVTLVSRLLRHFTGTGSEWTKKYRPVRVISVEEGTLSDEGKVTAKYIEKFGVNNVRGGWFNYSGEDESVILACYGRTNW
jgi:predicted GIY-YIG superfamily endonuclease